MSESSEETEVMELSRIVEGANGALVVKLHEPIVFEDEMGNESACRQITVNKVTLGSMRRLEVVGGEFKVLDLAAEICFPKGKIDEIANATDQDLVLEAVNRQRKKYHQRPGTTKS